MALIGNSELLPLCALAVQELQWLPSPINSTVQVNVPCTVGDCFFACVAVWLNVVFGSTLFDSYKLRMCLAAALAWPEAVCALDRVRDDLHHYNQMDLGADLAEMQRLVLKSTTWADHPIMTVMALFCSKLLGFQVGFLIVELDDTGKTTRINPAKSPVEDGGDDRALELACVLHLVRRDHYMLLADAKTKEMLFDVASMRWRLTESSDIGSSVSQTTGSELEEDDYAVKGSGSDLEVEEWTLTYAL